MRKFLLGASALVLVFTVSKCTYNAPAAYAGSFGCTNVWNGGKLTKTGKCNLAYFGDSAEWRSYFKGTSAVRGVDKFGNPTITGTKPQRGRVRSH
jgi:hypothetical protein